MFQQLRAPWLPRVSCVPENARTEAPRSLVQRFLFSSVAADWQLCAVSVDWRGAPLVLFQEGKPSRPDRDAGMDATLRWLNVPPKKHHLIHWRNSSIGQVTFENPTGLRTATEPTERCWIVLGIGTILP
jgi:hypothetical protein